jgi:hypothetical protein
MTVPPVCFGLVLSALSLLAPVPLLAPAVAAEAASIETDSILRDFGGRSQGELSPWRTRKLAALLTELAARLKPERCSPRDSANAKREWRLFFELAFGKGSPYARQFPNLYALSYQENERISRQVLEQVVTLALEMMPAHRLGLGFEPGASEGGPVVPSAHLTIVASRDEALTVAAVIGYLAQQSAVIGIGDGERSPRRALLLKKKGMGSWSDFSSLRMQWPELARLGPAGAFPGFSRLLTTGSDALLVIDSEGLWTRDRWRSFPEQIEKVARAINLPISAEIKAVSYLEVRNAWEDFGSGRTYLEIAGRLLAPEKLDALKRAADATIEPAIRAALKPLIAAKPSVKPQLSVPRQPRGQREAQNTLGLSGR